MCFNPRGRMGRDHVNLAVDQFDNRFNPRGRMGRDAERLITPVWIRVSIHAAAWAATSVRNVTGIS